MGAWENTVRGAQWMRSSFERVAPAMAAILPWAGGLLLLVAAAFAAHSWMFVHARIRAVATVTENTSAIAKQGGILYYPRLRFRAANGEIVKVLMAHGSDDIDFPAGEQVPVVYKAGNPAGAVIATPWHAYHAAIVFGLLGTALFDTGWAIRVLLRARLTRAGG